MNVSHKLPNAFTAGSKNQGQRRFAHLIWPSTLMIWSIGCLGCYRQSVVPPSASITRPTPQQPPPPVLTLPQPAVVPLTPPITEDNPWIPEATARNWKYIVLHHTATNSGDVESIHESHLKNKDKNGNPWLGIGYHFVIGNGNGMANGEIEPTFRWKQQIQGAHAGVADYNQHGIGIVLVGNFEDEPPSEAQLESVKKLILALTREYDISSSQIVGHGDVKPTECPGTHFPLAEIRRKIASSDIRSKR